MHQGHPRNRLGLAQDIAEKNSENRCYQRRAAATTLGVIAQARKHPRSAYLAQMLEGERQKQSQARSWDEYDYRID